jgi:arylsulfatase A-like enzyme
LNSGHYGNWISQQGYSAEEFPVKYLFDDDPNRTSDWDLPVNLHAGHWIVERATDFFQTHDHSRPFFLNLGFPDPHHPHILPKDYLNRIDPDVIPLPDFQAELEENPPPHIPLFRTGDIQRSRYSGRFRIVGQTPHNGWDEYRKDEHRVRATMAYYYGMIQLMDEQIGSILDALERSGLADNTLVIFTTDHGEMLGDHGIFQKGPLVFEGVTHIPLVMWFPSYFSHAVIEDCVSLTDIAPTILDFAEITDSTRRDGVSLKQLIRGGVTPKRHGVRVEYKEEPDRIRYKSWVTEDWKLAVYLGEEFGELYDLQNDPGEYSNLFHTPGYESTKNRLFTELINDMERSEPVCPRPTRG